MEELCAALDYAHGEGVIHRDLKPANLMVDAKGRLKLVDFGIAAVVNDSMSRVSVPRRSGTLAYMSPQQLAGQRPTVADDIYALGATLYELLTSEPPFPSGDVTHQILHVAPEPLAERLAGLGPENEIPADVASLVMACLAKEPENRPPSARAIAAWLGVDVSGQPSAQSLGALLGTGAVSSAPDKPVGPGAQSGRLESSAQKPLWNLQETGSGGAVLKQGLHGLTSAGPALDGDGEAAGIGRAVATDRRKRRKELPLFVVLGALLVGWAGWQFGVKPWLAKNAQLAELARAKPQRVGHNFGQRRWSRA